jgi:hypothetical protein
MKKASREGLAIGLLALTFFLCTPARSEMLALRCEGTKTTIPQAKEPELIKRKRLEGALEPEEEPDIPNTRKKEPFSTDVIVTDNITYAFGKDLETGVINDTFATFVYERTDPVYKFVLESLTGRINRITGVLEASWLKYRNSAWLYVDIEYSLNCKKVERKF